MPGLIFMGRVVFCSLGDLGRVVFWNWDDMGRVVLGRLFYGPSCPGPTGLWAELSWTQVNTWVKNKCTTGPTLLLYLTCAKVWADIAFIYTRSNTYNWQHQVLHGVFMRLKPHLQLRLYINHLKSQLSSFVFKGRVIILWYAASRRQTGDTNVCYKKNTVVFV